jgi:peptidoglycan/LPS O-acetylase OafA/YrhL
LYQRLLANQFWLWTYTANYLQATGAHTLPGFGHFWSLAIEEQFYWFWPLVVFFASRRKVFHICLAVCLLLPILRLVLIEFGGVREWAVRQYTFTRADALLAGALVAVVLREPQLLSEFRRLVNAAIGLSFVVLGAITIRNHYIPYEATGTVVIGYSCLAVLFAALVHKLATREGRIAQVLSSPALRWFGRYSYGIYIFHWPIAQAYRAALEPKLARALGSHFYPAEFAYVALLSWHLFEVRFLKFKEYFTYSTAERPKKVSALPVDTQLPELTGVNS